MSKGAAGFNFVVVSGFEAVLRPTLRWLCRKWQCALDEGGFGLGVRGLGKKKIGVGGCGLPRPP